MDGVNAQGNNGVKKTVHFGGARGAPEAKKDVESKEEKAVATLSLSVQVPAGDVGVLGENCWRGQSSMSQRLEKLRRAAEVFLGIRMSRTRYPTTMVWRPRRRWCRRSRLFSKTPPSGWKVDVEGAEVGRGGYF